MKNGNVFAIALVAIALTITWGYNHDCSWRKSVADQEAKVSVVESALKTWDTETRNFDKVEEEFRNDFSSYANVSEERVNSAKNTQRTWSNTLKIAQREQKALQKTYADVLQIREPLDRLYQKLNPLGLQKLDALRDKETSYIERLTVADNHYSAATRDLVNTLESLADGRYASFDSSISQDYRAAEEASAQASSFLTNIVDSAHAVEDELHSRLRFERDKLDKVKHSWLTEPV